MSALGMASLGTQCEDRALGMSSLGVFCDAVAPQPVVQDLVVDVVQDVVWPLVVDLTGTEQKRMDYDGTER